MGGASSKSLARNFRRFFFRGLAILLPSVLTIWILIAAYGFVKNRIAEPINRGVRELVLLVSPWPAVLEEELLEHERALRGDPARYAQWRNAKLDRDWLGHDARRSALANHWNRYRFPLDLIGLVLAAVGIYLAGAVLGSYLGRQMFKRLEEMVLRVPLIKQVYPSVKQVTDFLVGGGDEESASKAKFSKVVAVQYPRLGIWSLGLLTGDTMRRMQDQMGRPCVTVFVPSSPTPFTGYVITVPAEDTIELPVTIEEALRFVVSGGVVVPPSQQIGSESGPASQP